MDFVCPSSDRNMWFFCLYVNMIDYIDWLSNMESALPSWNKAPLVVRILVFMFLTVIGSLGDVYLLIWLMGVVCLGAVVGFGTKVMLVS